MATPENRDRRIICPFHTCRKDLGPVVDETSAEVILRQHIATHTSFEPSQRTIQSSFKRQAIGSTRLQ